MLTNEEYSSSSDDAEALREARDDNFLPQSLFSNDSERSSGDETETKASAKPSLRIVEQTDNFESFGVSQDYKNFVAEKLNAMLDRKIKVQDVERSELPVPKKKKKRKNSEAGIMLLSSSSKPMVTLAEPKDERPSVVIKPWKFTKKSEAANVAKCREVAVDPQFVLSKTETKAWNERPRGSVFKYRKSRNGTLIEQQ